MAKINSRQKGAAGEREFANICKKQGFAKAKKIYIDMMIEEYI